MIPTLLLLLPGLLALGLRARRVPAAGVGSILESRYAPVAIGLLWAALAWTTWGALRPTPAENDEIAYVLQAGIFASGRWAALAPPLPDFFGQPDVLVTPVLASKYPPGHSLLIALGALVGMPALIVFLLNAIRIGLTVALVRRVCDGETALLTTVLLYVSSIQVRFSSSFYSETTTGALLVVAWYCLLRWHGGGGGGGRRTWLIGIALALGWCAITRPWSAIAFAVPIAVVVLRDTVRSRRWRDLALPLAAGVSILAILPLWSWRTLGDWRRLPLLEYARDYMPYDHPHFGVTRATPRLTPPPDVARVNAQLLEVERSHTLGNLIPEAVARARFLWDVVWPPPTIWFAGLALIALAVLPAAAWTAVGTAAALFVVYLAHPTWPQWTVYYFEVTPVLTFLGALGIMTVFRALAGELREGNGRARRRTPRAALAGLTACVLLLPALPGRSVHLHRWIAASVAPRERFEAQVARLPTSSSIVFVRPGPQHSPLRGLVVNRADWATAPAWIVHDRGVDNLRLQAVAPERRSYLYDESTDRFVQMPTVPDTRDRQSSLGVAHAARP